jgi:hypothetical protein
MSANGQKRPRGDDDAPLSMENLRKRARVDPAAAASTTTTTKPRQPNHVDSDDEIALLDEEDDDDDDDDDDDMDNGASSKRGSTKNNDDDSGDDEIKRAREAREQRGERGAEERLRKQGLASESGGGVVSGDASKLDARHRDAFDARDTDGLEALEMKGRWSGNTYNERAGGGADDDDDNSDATGDEWLDGVDDATVAGAAKQAMAKAAAAAADDDDDDVEIDPLALRRTIVNCLLEGETIVTALRRLGGSADKKKKQQQQAKKKKKKNGGNKWDTPVDGDGDGDGGDGGVAETAEEKAEKKRQFDAVTDAADALLSAGVYNVFGETRRRHAFELRTLEEEAAARAKAAASGVMQWQYKWSKTDPTIHGPFGGSEMDSWAAQGFFKDAFVRCLAGSPAAPRDWTHASKVESFAK